MLIRTYRICSLHQDRFHRLVWELLDLLDHQADQLVLVVQLHLRDLLRQDILVVLGLIIPVEVVLDLDTVHSTQVVPQQDIMVQIVVDTVVHRVDILEVVMVRVADILLVREEVVSIHLVVHRIVTQPQELDIHPDLVRTIFHLVDHRVILLKVVDQADTLTLDHSRVHPVNRVDLQLAVLQVLLLYLRYNLAHLLQDPTLIPLLHLLMVLLSLRLLQVLLQPLLQLAPTL